MGYTNSEDLCLKCVPLTPRKNAVESHINKNEFEEYAAQLAEVVRTKLTLYKGVPMGACQAFSLALNYCHFAELEAKTDRDLWKAKIQLAKLKAIWVIELRGGKKRGQEWRRSRERGRRR